MCGGVWFRLGVGCVVSVVGRGVVLGCVVSVVVLVLSVWVVVGVF